MLFQHILFTAPALAVAMAAGGRMRRMRSLGRARAAAVSRHRNRGAVEHAGPRRRVIGIATDKVRAAFGRAAVPYTIELLPWRRAYAAARTRPDACVYSTTRTPDRDALFKWIGPIDKAEWVLMARADSGICLHTLEDARPYRIGTYHGDARDGYLRSRGFRVDGTSTDFANPRKLLLGRIDLWAASLGAGPPAAGAEWLERTHRSGAGI